MIIKPVPFLGGGQVFYLSLSGGDKLIFSNKLTSLEVKEIIKCVFQI